MANTKSTTEYTRKAIIDTNPSAGGFWLDPVSIRGEDVTRLFFSIKGNENAITTLQFKATEDSTWTDYESYPLNGRYIIEGGGAGIEWRVGVKENDYTSGTTEITFDW